MKTTIVNKTKQSFELKEGNAEAYRFLTTLGPVAKFSIKVDPNATYREYVVATGKKGESVFLTSDDFIDYKVIYIEETTEQNSGTKIYKSVPSNPRKPHLSKASQPSTVGGAGVGSDPPTTSAGAAGSGPPASSLAGAGSDPRALPVATPPIGNSNQNERGHWFRKLISGFNRT